MARRSRNNDEPKKGAPEWMTTYGDMVTLLLCFFVLLFAFSEIDVNKFRAIIKSFQGSLGILESGTTVEPSEYISAALEEELTTKQEKEIEDFKKLEEKLQEYLEEKGLDSDVMVTLEPRGLVLRFQDNVLFDSGKADLKEYPKTILKQIVEFFDEPEFIDKAIRVEGHTDNVPTGRNSKYPTNWELSFARAGTVVRYFVEELGVDPHRVSGSGYSKYHPVAPNDTKENKAKNRRVEIVILKSQFVITSP